MERREDTAIEEKRCWHRSWKKKKKPRWESTAAVRWCFFVESQIAKPCFTLLAGCFVQVHLVYVEFTSLHRHTSQGTASGPTPDTANTPTRAGTVKGGLTVLSTASAGCPHCQCSWQGWAKAGPAIEAPSFSDQGAAFFVATFSVSCRAPAQPL